MATRKRTKKQSLGEFRAWLSGVEELQPDNWAPNAAQWKLIRDKIDGIALPKAVATAPAPVVNAVPQHGTGNPYAMQAAHIPPPPPAAGGVPQGAMTAPTPEAAAVMPTQAPVDLSKPATANLDNSDGNYESGFS